VPVTSPSEHGPLTVLPGPAGRPAPRAGPLATQLSATVTRIMIPTGPGSPGGRHGRAHTEPGHGHGHGRPGPGHWRSGSRFGRTGGPHVAIIPGVLGFREKGGRRMARENLHTAGALRQRAHSLSQAQAQAGSWSEMDSAPESPWNLKRGPRDSELDGRAESTTVGGPNQQLSRLADAAGGPPLQAPGPPPTRRRFSHRT
jgi:hypothetical protein